MSESEDINTGVKIVIEAIRAPFDKVVVNAGDDPGEIRERISAMADSIYYGYDANDGMIKDLMKAGIIDPVKVTRIALKNAASIASMLITSECIITNIPKPEPTVQYVVPQM